MTVANLTRIICAAALSAAISAVSVPAHAAGSHGGGQSDSGMSHSGEEGHGHDGAAHIGKPGKLADISRTIVITMHDSRYEPESIQVKPGETVRFVIRNQGELLHEFALATAAMHRAHGPEMMMMMEKGVLEPDRVNREAEEKMRAQMGYGIQDKANRIMLEPGKSAEMIWMFPTNAEAALQFACNVPGHYDIGMVGAIEISP
tara:strand:- start:2762 stop:3370 length:609 start_codon:yes stop_codon:yes gene_type:complete